MRRTGLVLAGGASSRFGVPKALASFDGTPMVRRVCDVLDSWCGEILVSISARADSRPLCRAVPGARLVPDARTDQGPIEGFRSGFAAARGDLVLVAPSDAPLLQPTLYAGLLAILGNHDAAVPRHQAMDPIRAVYRRTAVESVLRDTTVASPSALADRLDAVFLEGTALTEADPMGCSFVDVNRREDLVEALRVSSGIRRSTVLV